MERIPIWQSGGRPDRFDPDHQRSMFLVFAAGLAFR
jgi:hypothetical protein